MGDGVQGAVKPGEGQGRTLSCSILKYSFLKKDKKCNSSLKYDAYIIMCIPWEGTRILSQGCMYYCCLTDPSLSLHLLPSLMSNCLNLSLGIQGRSWWLNEAHFLRTRNGEHRKVFAPMSPTGPCLVSTWPWWNQSLLLLNSLPSSTLRALWQCVLCEQVMSTGDSSRS